MNAIRSVNRYQTVVTEKPVKSYVVHFTRKSASKQAASNGDELFFKSEMQCHSEHVAWAIATEQFLKKFPDENLDNFNISVELAS